MEMTIVTLISSYLLGAIPFGYLVVKFWKGVDIRQHGSHNIGFTNALRVGGKVLGIIVLLFDVGKGVVPVLLISQLAGNVGLGRLHTFITMQTLCGLLSIIGHNWSVYLGFKGGKGISTTIGVFLALNWRITLAGLLIWLIAVIITRYVSLGSILFAVSLPVAITISHLIPQIKILENENWTFLLVLSVIVAVMAIFKHSGNIGRLLNGSERKIGEKVKRVKKRSVR